MRLSKSMRTFFTVIGIFTVLTAAVSLVLNYLNNKVHDEKWQDYYDCGI